MCVRQTWWNIRHRAVGVVGWMAALPCCHIIISPSATPQHTTPSSPVRVHWKCFLETACMLLADSIFTFNYSRRSLSLYSLDVYIYASQRDLREAHDNSLSRDSQQSTLAQCDEMNLRRKVLGNTSQRIHSATRLQQGDLHLIYERVLRSLWFCSCACR